MRNQFAASLVALLSTLAHASDMYVRDDDVDISGTYNLEYIDVIPRFLVSNFGEPNAGDGIRVSGLYTFVSEAGEVFTLYDYKSTTLWAEDEGLPTAEEFWSATTKQEMSVGGEDGSDYLRFIKWLLAAQQRWQVDNDT